MDSSGFAVSRVSIDFDAEKFYLSGLCGRRHEWKQTGHSLRSNSLRSIRTKICLECGRLNSRRYRQRHPDKADESVRQYRRQHPDVQERSIKRRRASGQNAEATRRWRQNHPEHRVIHAEQERLRRFKKRTSRRANYTADQLRERFAQFDDCCSYCNSSQKLTADHFISIAAGGADCLNNIIPACFSCNSSKQASDPWEWYQKQAFYSQSRWMLILSVLGKQGYG